MNAVNKKTVNPDFLYEGEKLESARLRKKSGDKRYSQSYVASLVGMGQNIWYQWQRGITRIPDEYWLVFADELGFDPFETRPELKRVKALLDKAAGDEADIISLLEAMSDQEALGAVLAVARTLPKETRKQLIGQLTDSL